MATNMNRPIGDLASFPDERVFKEVSEGIPLIVRNAVSLDEAAQLLYRQKKYRVSEIVSGFAEEEAAKVLILIDLVRCPREKQRAETANRFHGHVAKRIYAMTCTYPRIASFKELCELVERECRPYYLDGPNDVDWIFPNSIAEEREQLLYVDYVRNITDESDGYYWRDPPNPLFDPPRYETPDCVKLSQALLEAGAGSPDGLATMADIWRRFEPEPVTGREELQGLIAHTLDRLGECGFNSADESSMRLIVSHWSFPLWPLPIKEPRRKLNDVDALREERVRTIEWIEETQAKRSPPPAVSRSKMEALSEAHAAWMRDVDERERDRTDGGGVMQFRPAETGFELPSYKRLQDMYRELTEEERAALLALAWFGREIGVADWPRIYARAREKVGPPDDGYDIGLGSYWLAGLHRWEEEPRPFKAGQWYRGA